MQVLNILNTYFVFFDLFHINFLILFEIGPNKVIEIKTDSLGNLPVLHRDEGMVLYGPALGQIESRKIQYEIVLNRLCSDNLNTAFR